MTHARRKRLCRVLLVEDDDNRHAWFLERISRLHDVRLVWAKTGGAAIAILNKDPPGTYFGLMLDHDLDKHSGNDMSLVINGKKVVETVIRRVDTGTPILVHSANTRGGPAMAAALTGAGFEVTRVMFADLTTEALTAWLKKVQEWFDAETEDDAEG